MKPTTWDVTALPVEPSEFCKLCGVRVMEVNLGKRGRCAQCSTREGGVDARRRRNKLDVPLHGFEFCDVVNRLKRRKKLKGK